MNNPQPLFDSTTHYQIEVRGRVDVEWLQSFDSSAKVSVDEAGPREEITLLDVHADQAGMVGLVRRLHGLRITILQLEIVPQGGKAAEVDVRD